MIMCVLLCYPVSIHISQLLSTGRPISSFKKIVVLVIIVQQLIANRHPEQSVTY